MGLLRFYTEEFDFKEYVISIRQKKLLTTFEKQWTSKCIAIEGNYSADIRSGIKKKIEKPEFHLAKKIDGKTNTLEFGRFPFEFYQCPSFNL